MKKNTKDSKPQKQLLFLEEKSLDFPKTIFGFYFKMLRKFWKTTLSIFVLYMITDVLNGIVPALSVRWIIDGIAAASPDAPILPQMMPIIWLITGCYLTMYLTDFIGEMIRRFRIPYIYPKLDEILYRRLSKMSVAFFKKNSAGFIVQRMQTISGRFTTIAIYNINSLVSVFIILAVNITLLFKVHWTAVAVFAICAGYRIIHSVFMMNMLWTTAEKRSKTEAVIVDNYIDSLSNFMNLKLFQRKNYENKYLNKIRDKYIIDRMAEYGMRNKFWIIPYFVEQVGKIALAIFLIHFYRIEKMNLGDVAFALTSFMTMMSFVRTLVWSLPDIAGDLASASQAYKDLIQPIDIEEASDAIELAKTKHYIDFKDISFRYNDNERWIFKNMNLTIQKGERVGFVGLSGSGKSTLLYLLMRLYDLNSGSIRIDGKDIKTIKFDNLRENVSFVPQDAGMFNRSVAENISYANPDASRQQIINAAKDAHAHEFILGMENKYDSSVGERGLLISGGQRQRLAIARTICHNAPIVVMDEATSALDSKTEEMIQNSMEKILKNKTAIVVAHRLSTLRKMDRIIVLDKGEIVEEGPHAELLKKENGIYAKLWSMQVGGFIK